MERWKVNLYTIWFAQIFTYISFGFGIPFLSYYIQDLGVTQPDSIKFYSGLLNTVCGLAGAVATPIWGTLADKFGKKLMLLRAIFCASLIIAGMGLARNVHHLIILRTAQGLFTGTVTAAAILIASSTPKSKISYALGFLSSSTFIGNSLGPVLGGFVSELVGYRVSFLIGGFLMLLTFFLVLFTVKEGNVFSDEPKKAKPRKVPIHEIFTPSILILVIVLIFVVISNSVFSPYLPLYIQEFRKKVEGASGITGMINGFVGIMTALSGVIFGRLADKYNKRSILAIVLISGVVISIPLSMLKSLWVFAFMYAILFFFIGAVNPIITSISSEATSDSRQGMLFGVIGFVTSLGFALSPMLGSAVSIKYSLQTVLVVIPVALTLALTTLLVQMHKFKSSKVNNRNESMVQHE